MTTTPKPRLKGYLQVSATHKLYYELVGSPRGIPCVFFHGGPGAGFDDRHKRFFDFKKYQVLFFDQRGASRSKPFCSLEGNTSPHLVADTFKLMDFVGFRKALFFGGSWGSTLALLAALKAPKRCSGLVLHGLFLANREANKFYLQGEWRTHFPDIWERFAGQVPPRYRKDPAKYYLEKMLRGAKAEQRKFCFEWARFEYSLMKPFLSAKTIDRDVRSGPFELLAKLEAHYITKRCFIPENYILKNAAKLSKLPTWIFHGRHDFVCPPAHAYQLHKKIRGSKLEFLDCGHSSSAPAMEEALKGALREFSKTHSFRG